MVDNYTLFENNAKKIVAANLKLSVNMVVTKDNLHEIRATAEKMKKIGCRAFSTTPMALNMEYPRLDLLLSKDEVRQVINDLLWAEKTLELKVDCLDVLPKCLFSDKILSEDHLFLSRKCQAGRSFIAVSCNGDVRPCANNTTSYGNILEEELKTIWKKMSDWRSMQYVPKKCEKCTWLNRCLGGCRTNAKVFSGKWNAEDVWGTMPLKAQPPLHKKPIELTDNINFEINSEYLYRQEYENVFVVFNVRNNMFFMINKEYFDFVQELKEYGIVNFGELKKQYNVTAKNKSFHYAIKFLVQCKILKPIV
ncbi:radical SAM protein [Brucepastera parasyntrophica]|uniref:radical SAM protein n=1 Tax=Brucepastera parasyntrophica TaxID=2880008 RepID=UPI00210A6804|nr:radical SAM protein [Brucepastera parasyntrophica]ULQ60679.1 radical SAM protein [Brucepastera parasyntrophica]